MSKIFKKSFFAFVFMVSSSFVLADVAPKNVIVFFLPMADRASVDSPQEAVPTKFTPGMIKSGIVSDLPADNNIQREHGIVGPNAVSLHGKAPEVSVRQAMDRVLAPAKVMVLPDENTKKRKGVAGLPENENPVAIRVFPLPLPREEILKTAAERPIIVSVPALLPPSAEESQRPADQSLWTAWVSDQLQKCGMNEDVVLPTLYWLMSNHELKDKTDCQMKSEVADFLRKCHPWPTKYYTAENNDVQRRPAVQLAVEVLETPFDSLYCPVLNLSGVNFQKTDFLQGTMRGHDFSGSFFKESTFADVDLSESNFDNALMENVLFQNASLSKASFKNAELPYAHFYKSKAEMADFSSAKMDNVQVRSSNFSVANLNSAVSRNSKWQDVQMYRLRGDGALLSESEFDNIIASQAKLRHADLSQIKCENCVFNQASLQNANLRQSSFSHTFVKYADLSYANFTGARFKTPTDFSMSNIFNIEFSKAGLRHVKGVDAKRMEFSHLNQETELPEDTRDFEESSFDEELKKIVYRPEDSLNAEICSARTCKERLSGKVSAKNLAVRATTLLVDPKTDEGRKMWAVCTIGCIAKQDKKLENSMVDTLTAYIRRERPWSVETDMFKPYTPIPHSVQAALYVLTDPKIERDLGYDVNLTKTDLRTADLSGANLKNVNFAGSHLGGVDFRNAETDRSYDHFDQTVLDQFTILSKTMSLFRPFKVPDSQTPPWWKPKTVRVIRDHYLWGVTTENVPFADHAENKK